MLALLSHLINRTDSNGSDRHMKRKTLFKIKERLEAPKIAFQRLLFGKKLPKKFIEAALYELNKAMELLDEIQQYNQEEEQKSQK